MISVLCILYSVKYLSMTNFTETIEKLTTPPVKVRVHRGHPDYDKILLMTQFLPYPSTTMTERALYIKFKQTKRARCPVCSGPSKIDKRIYDKFTPTFCSIACKLSVKEYGMPTEEDFGDYDYEGIIEDLCKLGHTDLPLRHPARKRIIDETSFVALNMSLSQRAKYIKFGLINQAICPVCKIPVDLEPAVFDKAQPKYCSQYCETKAHTTHGIYR